MKTCLHYNWEILKLKLICLALPQNVPPVGGSVPPNLEITGQDHFTILFMSKRKQPLLELEVTLNDVFESSYKD